MYISALYRYLVVKRFWQYAVVGSSSFVLDFLGLVVLKEWFGMDPVWAVAVEQVVVIAYVFLLNKYWSFRSRAGATGELVRFLLVLVWNYLFAVAWMWFWVSYVGVSYVVSFGGDRDLAYIGVRVANIVIGISWNFLLYKYWVYRYRG